MEHTHRDRALSSLLLFDIKSGLYGLVNRHLCAVTSTATCCAGKARTHKSICTHVRKKINIVLHVYLCISLQIVSDVPEFRDHLMR